MQIETSLPVKPDDLLKSVTKPWFVISAFNKLIEKYFDGTSAKFTQKEVCDCICGLVSMPRQEIYDQHLLDIEFIFENVGWEVEYDKPGYNESYEPTFEFRIKGK